MVTADNGYCVERVSLVVKCFIFLAGGFLLAVILVLAMVGTVDLVHPDSILCHFRAFLLEHF